VVLVRAPPVRVLRVLALPAPVARQVKVLRVRVAKQLQVRAALRSWAERAVSPTDLRRS